jgi:hypothetical protein
MQQTPARRMPRFGYNAPPWHHGCFILASSSGERPTGQVKFMSGHGIVLAFLLICQLSEGIHDGRLDQSVQKKKEGATVESRPAGG